MAIISLENMEFFSYHGCFAEEQVIGTRFIVNLHFETETSEAERTDDLSKTINYHTVYLMVKAEMEQKSKLLEHVARRILDKLRETWPAITTARVKVSKMNPPLGGQLENVSVELSF
jgi:dihydroneopterin aldolase